MRSRIVVAALAALALAAGSARAASLLDSLKPGTPDLKSAGALAFGPEGILFVGDPLGGAVFAVDSGDRPAKAAEGALKVDSVGEKVAGLLGVEVKQVLIKDLAVNPLSGNAYLSVARGQGAQSQPVLLRVNRSGKIEELSLKNVKFARADLPNVPAADAKDRRGQPQRLLSITGMAYVDGRLVVAGLSNEEFASKLRAIPFPFGASDKGTSVEIWHGAHGKLETQAPVRAFATYKIDGQDNILAAYTCTPLVKFPVSDLKPGQKVQGKTVAELGNMNNPIDMIVYNKDGKDYVLLANDRRGVMKITTDNISGIAPITKPVPGGGKAGLTYETVNIAGGKVDQMARLDAGHALVLVQATNGTLNLETIALP